MVKEKFEKDMKEVAPGQEKPNYVNVIEGFQNKEKGLHEEVAQLKRDIEKLRSDFAVREKSKEKVIAEAQEKFRKANERKEALDKEKNELMAKKDAGLQETFSKHEETIKSLTKDVSKGKANIEKAHVAADEKQKENDRLVEALDKTIRPPQDSPQGHLIYIDPSGRQGTIDLGKADGVTRGLSFSVYDAMDMSEQGKKGAVEVISVVEPRRAEVRIFNEDENYPIGVDDVAYSPTWSPGFKEHFALLGFMDIEGDGSNDLQIVKSLIERNGGVVDAYQNEDGSLEGRITQRTTWAVDGQAPDVEGKEADDPYLQNYTNLQSQVKKFRTKGVPLHELLRKMGYRPPSEMRGKEFLSGGDGVKRTSSGTVSKLYMDEETAKKKPERKPGASKNSAY